MQTSVALQVNQPSFTHKQALSYKKQSNITRKGAAFTLLELYVFLYQSINQQNTKIHSILFVQPLHRA